MQKQALILGLGAAVLLVSGFVFGDLQGAVATAAGMAFGWMVRHLTPSSVARTPSAPAPVVAAPAVVGPVVAAPVVAAPAVAAPAVAALDDAAMQRLAQLEATTSSLRHDLRGILSPALLIGERLLNNPDPAVKRAGEIMVKTVERASARLAETKAA